MATFEQGDVVKVPFPCADQSTRQFRPVMVVSTPAMEIRHGLIWVVMITSAENQRLPDDFVVTRLADAGLPVPSVIRSTRIATIAAAQAMRLGRISADLRRQVVARIGKSLGE